MLATFCFNFSTPLKPMLSKGAIHAIAYSVIFPSTCVTLIWASPLILYDYHIRCYGPVLKNWKIYYVSI